jgi:hypothetical protein
MSEASGEAKIAGQAIRDQLSRILEGPIFAQSERLARFLRFTVQTTLAGNADVLKEYLIGTEVYDRKPPYHPTADSIVRSEARRLRNKLKQYYESFGKKDAVFIYYRPSSYVPTFRHQRTPNCGDAATNCVLRELLTEGLINQAVVLGSAAQRLDVQIVFEGTIRVLGLRAESSAPTDFRLGANIAKRTPIRKVVSMSSRKAAEG